MCSPLCLNLVYILFISFTYFNCLIYVCLFVFNVSTRDIWRQLSICSIYLNVSTQIHLILDPDCPFFFLGNDIKTRILLTWWLKYLWKLSFFSLANTCFINRDCSLIWVKTLLMLGDSYAGWVNVPFAETPCCLCPLSSGRLWGWGLQTPLQDFSPGGWSSHATSIASPGCRLKCVDHGVIKQWGKTHFEFMEAEYSGHKSHHFVMKNTGLFKIGRQDAVYFFKRERQPNPLDCILLFSVDLLIHRYLDKRHGWREDACAPWWAHMPESTSFRCWTLTL